MKIIQSIIVSLCGTLASVASPALAAESQFDVPYSSPANYTAHGKLFQERVTHVGASPVWLLEFPGMNLVVVEGGDGLIVVDTAMNQYVASNALAKIRAQISAKPIKAIVYTHHHPDHVNGSGVFVARADVESGKVPIFAAANFLKELSDEGVATLAIVATRAAYMYGFSLEGKEAEDFHVGCCGGLNDSTENEAAYIPPTQFVDVDGERDVEIAGIKLHLFYTGGEAASEIAVWLPDYKVLISGDEIQGPTFPNLHSMRGTKMRDADRWITALRRMQRYPADYMVPLHGPVVSGAPVIKALLARYEDAIQYTHDQTIRLIDKGVTENELPGALGPLPDWLRSEPYTTEYYGTVADAARSYYVGYVSWFSGDATDLAPTPRPERARREVQLMGGRARILDAATQAFGQGDAQWAAELTTLLIAIDHEDMEARHLKAAAFRKLGYATYNSNRRGFYLMGAMELEGRLNPQGLTARYMNPENLKRMPAPLMLEWIRYRVDPKRAGPEHVNVALNVAGESAPWILELRNSTLKKFQGDPDGLPSVTLDRGVLGDLVSGAARVNTLASNGAIKGGGIKALAQIFEVLDLTATPINLVVR